MIYELISESTPKARKEHKCIWCGETIHEGEHYHREVCTFEGDFHNNPWHLECDDAASQWMALGDNGFDYEFIPYEQQKGEWPE